MNIFIDRPVPFVLMLRFSTSSRNTVKSAAKNKMWTRNDTHVDICLKRAQNLMYYTEKKPND